LVYIVIVAKTIIAAAHKPIKLWMTKGEARPNAAQKTKAAIGRGTVIAMTLRSCMSGWL